MTARALTLFLPIRNARLAWAATTLVGIYYAISASRDMTFYDSAELALVAQQLGVSHPIGQPLHTLLGFLFSHIPHVSPLVGLTWLSVLPAALCVLPVLSLSDSMMPSEPARPSGALVRAATVVLACVAPPMWQMATRVEVYALATFLSLWFFARATHLLGRQPPAPTRDWLLLGLSLGLVATANAYIASLTALAFAPTMVSAFRRGALTFARARWMALGALLALALYAYVPLAALRRGAFAWGLPNTPEALWNYFRGAEYEHNRGTSLPLFAEHLNEWLAWSLRSLLLGYVLFGIGAFFARGKDTALGRLAGPVLFAASLALLASHKIFFPDIPDYMDYLAPGILLLTSGVAATLSRAGQAFAATRTPAATVTLGLGALVLAAFSLVASPRLLQRSLHRDHAARVLAEGALHELPPHAILIAAQDHWVAPLLYLQESEHQRTDVVVLAYGLAGSSWYWNLLNERHPDLSPFDPRATRDTPSRVRAFLAANSDRAVYVADPVTLGRLGLPACDVGYSLRVGADCDPSTNAHAATRALANAMNQIDLGSPTGMQALAAVAFGRARSLFLLGRPSDGAHAALAGVPPTLRPGRAHFDLARISRTPRFDAAERVPTDRVALGSPERLLRLLEFVSASTANSTAPR